MSSARVVTRVFVGLINKVNFDKMVDIADHFLRRYGVRDFVRIDPHSQGFIVTFHSPKLAESAVHQLDDRNLPDAVGGEATARVLDENENDIAIVSRMERELWVVPAKPGAWDDDVVRLVDFLANVGLCDPVPGSRTRADFIETLIDALPQPSGKVKYIVLLKSPEAVICAAGLDTAGKADNPLKLLCRLDVIVSTACHHKFRHDMFSTVLFIPDRWLTNFEQDKLFEWTEQDDVLRAMRLKQLKTKVRTPHAVQLFTVDRPKQGQLIRAIMDRQGNVPNRLPLYWGVTVRAATWENYIMHRYAPAELPVQTRLAMDHIVEGVPEELAALNGKLDIGRGEQDDDLADCYYSELAQLRNPCEFIVYRDQSFSGQPETVAFSDIFIFTKGYQQSALKRTDTIRQFQPQLSDLIEQTGAHTGLILNHHVSFDALSGIVFQLIFRRGDIAKANRALGQVKQGKIVIRDVIQQNYDSPIKTDVLRGVGFSAAFPAKCSRVTLDLVTISKNILDNYSMG